MLENDNLSCALLVTERQNDITILCQEESFNFTFNELRGQYKILFVLGKNEVTEKSNLVAMLRKYN